MRRLWLAAEFHDDATRARSPEWDFGVHWAEDEPTDAVAPGSGLLTFPPPWTRWRLSWIVLTGELYAQAPGGIVQVLAVLPAVGEYPYGDLTAWGAFKDAQTVEKALAGWAGLDYPPPLSWARGRARAAATDSP